MNKMMVSSGGQANSCSVSLGSPLVPEDLALVAAPAAAKTVIISDCSRRVPHRPRSSHSDPEFDCMTECLSQPAWQQCCDVLTCALRAPLFCV